MSFLSDFIFILQPVLEFLSLVDSIPVVQLMDGTVCRLSHQKSPVSQDTYENVLELLQYWFEEEPETEKREYMSRFILSEGSWGSVGNTRLTEAAWNMNKAGNTKRAKYLFYIQRLFPSAALISGAYPILCKAPWLLPFFWMVRLFDKMFIKRNFVRTFRQTSQQLSTDGIAQKKYELHLVGLDRYI